MSMQPAKKTVERLINSERERERERDLRQFWLKTEIILSRLPQSYCQQRLWLPHKPRTEMGVDSSNGALSSR